MQCFHQRSPWDVFTHGVHGRFHVFLRPLPPCVDQVYYYDVFLALTEFAATRAIRRATDQDGDYFGTDSAVGALSRITAAAARAVAEAAAHPHAPLLMAHLLQVPRNNPWGTCLGPTCHVSVAQPRSTSRSAAQRPRSPPPTAGGAFLLVGAEHGLCLRNAPRRSADPPPWWSPPPRPQLSAHHAAEAT